MTEESARLYFDSHNLQDVFQNLSAALVLKKPADPLKFLQDCIALVRTEGQGKVSLDTLLRAGDTSEPSIASVPVEPVTIVSKPTPTARLEDIPFVVGVATDKNGNPMEDELLAVTSLGGPIRGCAGVFDGHSTDKRTGRSAAVICRNNLYPMFCLRYDEIIREGKIAPAECVPAALRAAFAGTESVMRQCGKEFLYAGATATLCVVLRSGEDYSLYTANAGDSTAIIVSKDGTVRVLSVDHNTSNDAEVARAESEGAFCSDDARFGKRVNGLLVTRSVGDLGCVGTVSDPDISTHVVHSGDTLVVASDGLWGELSFAEVAAVVTGQCQASATPVSCAAVLLAEAVRRSAQPSRHRDNVSIVVMYL